MAKGLLSRVYCSAQVVGDGLHAEMVGLMNASWKKSPPPVAEPFGVMTYCHLPTIVRGNI